MAYLPGQLSYDLMDPDDPPDDEELEEAIRRNEDIVDDPEVPYRLRRKAEQRLTELRAYL